MTTPDYSHAIEHLRGLIEFDFENRHGVMGVNAEISKHWWDHPSRREDIAKLRSYITAVKVLEGRAKDAKEKDGLYELEKLMRAPVPSSVRVFSGARVVVTHCDIHRDDMFPMRGGRMELGLTLTSMGPVDNG